MSLRFGTDGVRGVANTELSPELVFSLGRAAARVLGGDRFVVGRDTRISGTMLEAALAAGLTSEGVSVSLLGVVPTPAVAFASQLDNVPGAVISASHNPFADNGVKFFAAGGLKLPDNVERRLEAELDRLLAGASDGRPVAADLGVITSPTDEVTAYIEHVVGSVAPNAFAGLSIVLDCANGAAATIGPDVFRQLGARVTVIAAEPTGTNINADCGSTYPQQLQARVVAEGAHLGLAFDGDADRVLAVDHTGALIDGDHVIAILARDLDRRAGLRDHAVVVTVMTNLGFRLAMQAVGIDVVETAVGDRYVLETLDARHLSLGGEQSGHVIFRDLATTGDGILTGVQLLDVVARTSTSLASLASAAMSRLPQVLVNVRLPHKGFDLVPALASVIATVERDLGESGRVLVRPSGTEPLVRIMVEAATPDAAQEACDRIAAVASAEIRRHEFGG
jgi:phosphoglucosamine mutase